MALCEGSALRCNTKDTAALLSDDKFLALEEKVEVLTNFSSDQAVDCIKGKFGPFRANSAIEVPLWAALEMNRLHQCTIEPPAWLHEEELKRMRDEEKETSDFQKVPEHYIETAFALLSESSTYANRLREKERMIMLLRELMEVRRNKITTGLKEFTVHPGEICVTNMSAVEMTCFRTRSLHALDSFLNLLKLSQAKKSMDMPSQGDTTADFTSQEDSMGMNGMVA
eukprot:TRINITY_DN45657_c0_g1_i1.p1 TRINITY_DN45657_c0_g1~~TRINITY_DN45657_c0_g1_i1.p1  ORF type:complete len:252 (+),score=65.95 TRINITY_DN45657_c0_g1_i1:80-757(+)